MISFDRWYWMTHGKPQMEEEKDECYNDDWTTADHDDKMDYLLMLIEELVNNE